MSITGNGRPPREIAKNLYLVVGRPVQYATLFYTTYYLTEIEGVGEARPDFIQLRDDLFVAFQDYGLYSVVHEISNVWTGFRLIDESPSMSDEGMVMDRLERMFLLADDEMDDPFTDDERNLVRDIFREAGGMRRVTSDRPNRATVIKVCNLANARWDAFDRPTRFLETCRKLFILDDSEGEAGSLDSGEREDHKIAEYGWSRAYGGRAWGGICDHLLRAEEMEALPTSWVDTAWAIQHNNANWLNKVWPAAEEIDHLLFLTDFPEMQNPRSWMYGVMLEQVLDWNQAGGEEWANIYPLAVTYNPAVSFDLRRYADVFGVDDLPPTDEIKIQSSLAGTPQSVGLPRRE